MRKHRRLISSTPWMGAAQILATAVLVLVSAAPALGGSANFFLGVAPDGLEEELSRYDEIVLSPIAADRSGSLYQIRQYNSNIKIFFLIDFFVGHGIDVNQIATEFHEGIEEEWKIKSTTGDYVHYWPDSYQVNITDYCPRVDGRNARDYIQEFFEERVQPMLSYCDGFYLDNCFESILWMSGYTGEIDLDLDGVGEEDMEILHAVQDGWRDLLDGIREVEPDIPIIGNGSNHLYTHLDGRMVEDFPNSSYNFIYGGLSMMETWRFTSDCKYSIVNSVAEEDDRKARRAAWAVSELTDQCVSYDSGPYGHNELQWDELFDFDIGRPRENVSLEGERYIHFDFEDHETLGYVPPELRVDWLSSDVRGGNEFLPLEGKWSIQIKNPVNSYQLLWMADMPPVGLANVYLSFRYKIVDAPPNGVRIWPAVRRHGSSTFRCGFGERQGFPGEEGHFIMHGDMLLFPGDDYYLYISAGEACTIIIDEIRLTNVSSATAQRVFDEGVLVLSLASEDSPVDLGEEFVACPDYRFDGAWYESEGETWLKAGETMVFVENPNPAPSVGGDEQRDEGGAPATGLGAAYPNPFNPNVTIPFSLAEAQRVRMTVYDIRGRSVRTLTDQVFGAGDQQVSWNGRDDAGRSLSSGVYFLKYNSDLESQTRKLVLAR